MSHRSVISGVWFFSLGGLGIFFPYYGLYLRENAGLTGTQMGIVLAMVPLAGIVVQPLWGTIGDRTGLRSRVLVALLLCAAIGYAVLYTAHAFVPLLLGTLALALFSAAIIPSSVAVTLALTRDAGPHAFGQARVWGTIGFLLVVVAFPYLLDAYQSAQGLHADAAAALSEPGLEIMFPATAALLACGGAIALALPKTGAIALRAPRGDWRRLLRHGPYVRVLLFCVAAYFFLQGPMTFFPVYVRAQGGTIDSVSHMWILMLALEIPLIALSGASLERLGARGLLAMGVIAGGARWALCGFVPDLRWIYPVQLLHGVVVAGLVIGAPLYVESVVPERLRSTAQGVLAMLGVSVGGLSSQLSTGWLVDHVGNTAPYAIGGVGALLLGVLVPVLLPAPSRPPPSADE